MAAERQNESRRRRHAAALAVLCGLLLGAGAAAGSDAPLDTLRETQADTDPATMGMTEADLGFSRRLLPDPVATTLPKSTTPNRPPRLDNPLAGAWNFHMARRAASAGNQDALTLSLQAAVDASPGRAEYRWWQTVQAIKRFDTASLVNGLPASVRSLLASPLGRARFLTLLHQAALLLTGFFWSVLVAGVWLATWRHLSHDLAARIFRDRRHLVRSGLPLLIPFVLVCLKPGWFGFLAAMSVPLLLVARGRMRGLLAATWLAALVLVYPAWPALRTAAPALDPESETVLLDRAAIMPPAVRYLKPLRERLATADDPARQARLQTALGIQEARRGRYDASNELFAAVLAHDPHNFPALVGIANNTYFLGWLDDAVGRYEAAAAMHPERGEIPYNLAQVFFKKLFVPEAAAALDRSRRLGFEAPAGGDNDRVRGFAPVVYPGLTAGQIMDSLRAEAGLYPNLVTVSAWRHLLGVAPVPPMAMVGLPLLVALLLISISRRQLDPRACENCGVPLCRSCCKVRDGSWLCAACGETADRARSDMILATLLKNRSRDEGLARTARIVRYGQLMPGAGHLASGHLAAAWIRLSLVAAGLFLVTAAWSFYPGGGWATPGLTLATEVVHPYWLPLPAGMWQGWASIYVLTGAALLVVAWLLALFDGPGLKRGLQDRHSLVPAATARKAAGRAS